MQSLAQDDRKIARDDLRNFATQSFPESLKNARIFSTRFPELHELLSLGLEEFSHPSHAFSVPADPLLLLPSASTTPRNCPCRCARNQPPTIAPTPPKISNSFPTTSDGNTISATPPSDIAALVVTLPMIALSGG